MSKQLKTLLMKEEILRNKLEKLIENGQQAPIDRRTRGFYEVKLEEIKRVWTEYEPLDQSINELLYQNPTSTTHKYITENNFGKLEAKYSDYVGEILDALHNANTDVTHINSTLLLPQTSQIEHEENVLPKIALPKYNGDYDGWRAFHDLFVALVHNNMKLKPVQKLFYLKTSLTGEAEKILRHVPVTGEDYLPSWLKLKDRYENSRILTNHQLKRLTEQPKLPTETSSSLKTLIDTSEECLQQLRSLNIDTSSWDILLIHLLVKKLPFITLKAWEESQGASKALPTYDQFKVFLNTRLKVLEAITDTLVAKANQTNNMSKTTKTYHVKVNTTKCPVCNETHPIHQCQRYQNMDIKAKRKLIITTGRCYNCLSPEHGVKECSSKFRCLKCKGKHHTSIHDNTLATKQTNQPTKINNKNKQIKLEQGHSTNLVTTSNKDIQGKSNSGQSANTSQTQVYMVRDQPSVLLSTALVLAQGEQGEPQTLRCLLDSGSESSFLTQSAFERLRTTQTPTSITILGLNACESAKSTNQTRLKLRTLQGNDEEIEENFFVIQKVTDKIPTTTISTENFKHLNKLTLADPTYHKPGEIDALLGAKVYAQILRNEIIPGSNNTPTAMNTMFGWVLLGSAKNTPNNTRTFMTRHDSLDIQLRQFWETEEVPSKPMLTYDEQQCQNYYKSSYERLASGKYQVKLPFRDNTPPILGESRSQAVKRFESLQRKFSKNQQLRTEYEKCLDEYLKLDHMEETDASLHKENCYYIPHHSVFKDSTTTKLRVVFDASAKTSNGNSLNQFLLKGPVLQPTLYITLLNWRKHRVVINADIEKMYRMVQIHPEHRHFQRIIWRNPTTNAVQDYQLKTVTFGTTSAPYLAIRTLQQLAEDERHHWPLAAVYTDFYVDDLLSGADNINQAKELQRQLIALMKSAHFNLRKWASNETQLLEHLPPEHVEMNSARTFSESESIKTLGLRWFPKGDTFGYVIKPLPKMLIYTKRLILSGVASLYDPLGWLAPMIIEAKLLMQTLWIIGLSWDAPVSKEISQQWEMFVSNLQIVERLRIPRWIQFTSHVKLQLHAFCDASAKAYASVIYLRVETENGDVSTHLLTAKTRIAPIKPITIPRLELNGALLLTKKDIYHFLREYI